jgi:hypothetical protein
MVELSTIAFGAGFVGFGLILAYVGYERLQLRRALAAHDKRRPAEVQPGESVLIEGTAHAADGTHAAPVDGEPAVVTEYKIESYDISSETGGGGGSWQTLKSEKLVEPFYIGDTDCVRVAMDTPDVMTTDASTCSREVSPEQLDQERNVLEQLVTDTTGEKMRHRQASIKDGQEVVVLGSAQRDDNGVVVGRGPHSSFFYVFDDVEAVSGAALYVAVGLFGVVLLLIGFGVIGDAVLPLLV